MNMSYRGQYMSTALWWVDIKTHEVSRNHSQLFNHDLKGKVLVMALNKSQALMSALCKYSDKDLLSFTDIARRLP